MSDGSSLINLDALGDVGKAFIEKVSEGIAGYARPWQIERVAKAEAKATLIKTGAELTADKLRTLASFELTEIQQRAMTRALGAEERNQKNIESISAKAIPQLKPDAKPQNVDSDWIANLFEKCKTVSNSEMQNLWSRILAGEANRPGLFTKRAIDIVASLDKSDANLFTSLCGFGWSFVEEIRPMVFATGDSIYSERGVTFDSLRHLESLGLVTFNGTMTYKYGLYSKHALTKYFDEDLSLEFQNDEGNMLPVGFAMMTQVGHRLATISGGSPVPGFVDYCIGRWNEHSVKATRLRKPKQ